jgi:EAL domain-containing protein (putative c-di-GMP-specific phosphodiesterase class I)/GGDEF domain-containing protein
MDEKQHKKNLGKMPISKFPATITETRRSDRAPPKGSRTGELPGIRRALALHMGESRSTLDNPHPIRDLVSGMGTLTTLHQEVAQVLVRKDAFTVFYVHLPNGRLIEDRYGWEAMEALTGSTAHFLRQISSRVRRDRGAASLNRVFADDFVLIAPAADEDANLRGVLSDGLARHISVLDDDLASASKVYVGFTTMHQIPSIHPERLVYRAVQRAQHDAMDVGYQERESQVKLLETSIAQNDFLMYFQPIVQANDLQVYGHEALVRCQTKELANPLVLFDVANKTNRARKLSRLLRRMTAQATTTLPPGQFMFMNLHPDDLRDPELLEPPDWLTRLGNRMVLEITERAAIGDFAEFRTRLQKLRNHKFIIAIDDLGSGYSALNTVAELEPEIIKLDMLLIRNIDKSQIRQDLVGRLVSFAETINCRVVAEGIETRSQYETVRKLGCHLLQGFYFARPGPRFLEKIDLD